MSSHRAEENEEEEEEEEEEGTLVSPRCSPPPFTDGLTDIYTYVCVWWCRTEDNDQMKVIRLRFVPDTGNDEVDIDFLKQVGALDRHLTS